MHDEEYKMIRKGLDQIYQTISNYNIALYTASGALFTFALGQDAFYYCLTPLMVIIPLYLLGEEKHKEACKLGAYLYVFCEGKTFKWERRNHDFGITYKGTRDIKGILQYVLLTIASCLLSILKILTNPEIQSVFSIVPISLLIVCLFIIKKGRINYSN